MFDFEPLLTLDSLQAKERGKHQSEADSAQEKTFEEHQPEVRISGSGECEVDPLRNREQSAERQRQNEHTDHRYPEFDGGAVHPVQHCPLSDGAPKEAEGGATKVIASGAGPEPSEGFIVGRKKDHPLRLG